jgi:outer membrane biosynthesis protein TonB
MYICSTSIAVSLPLAIYIKSGEIAIGAIAASVAGLAGGTAVLRTVDIKTKAKAAATMAQVVTPAGSATVTQGVQSTPTQPKTAGMG